MSKVWVLRIIRTSKRHAGNAEVVTPSKARALAGMGQCLISRVTGHVAHSTAPYPNFSLPIGHGLQLAHAILVACAGDVQPIEFDVDESAGVKSVAAWGARPEVKLG